MTKYTVTFLFEDGRKFTYRGEAVSVIEAAAVSSERLPKAYRSLEGVVELLVRVRT